MVSAATPAFLAIRDSEPTAIAFGINPTRYKLLAFCIGGAIAAAAGSIFAYLYINVDPTSFLFLTSVTFIGYAVITGIAELFGAVLVAFFFAILPQLTATPVSGVNQTIPLITGALLILTIYSYPTGNAGFLKRLVRPDDETRLILTADQFTPARGVAGDGEEAAEAEEEVWSQAAEGAEATLSATGGQS